MVLFRCSSSFTIHALCFISHTAVGPICGSILATAVYTAMFEKWDDGQNDRKPAELQESMKQYPTEDETSA